MHKPTVRKSIHDPPSPQTDGSEEDTEPSIGECSSDENLPEFNGLTDVSHVEDEIILESAHVPAMHKIATLSIAAQWRMQLGNSLTIQLAIVVAAIIVLVGVSYCRWFQLPVVCSTPELDTFFNLDEQVAIQVAVQEIKSYNKPSVLMFLHTPNPKHVKEMNTKLRVALNYTACKLNGGCEYVEITQEDMHFKEILHDKGKLIAKYKDDLNAKKVLLVKNLQDTPGQVAMAFHYLCDEYTPVVNNALIIFTLQHDEDVASMSAFNIVEKVLTDKWGGALKADFLPPLIARLTNAIISL